LNLSNEQMNVSSYIKQYFLSNIRKNKKALTF